MTRPHRATAQDRHDPAELFDFVRAVLDTTLRPFLPEDVTLTLVLKVPDPGQAPDYLVASDEPDLSSVRNALTGFLATQMADAQDIATDDAPAILH